MNRWHDATLKRRMMSGHFNGLTPAEAERLAILSEEMGEAQQAVGKILRHGYQSHNPNDMNSGTNQQSLERELGDVLCAVRMLINAGDVSYGVIEVRRNEKAVKVKKYMHHFE